MSKLERSTRTITIPTNIWRLAALFIPLLLTFQNVRAEGPAAAGMTADALTAAVLYSCSAIPFMEAAVEVCITAYPEKKDEITQAFEKWKKRNEGIAVKLGKFCKEKGDPSWEAQEIAMRQGSVKILQDSEQDRIRACRDMAPTFASNYSDIERSVPEDMLRQIQQK